MSSTQVLIIGAGPVGMLTALSLSQAGIQCVLVDKRLERLDAPKAHAVNPRTLEICQRLGVEADAIRAAGASHAEGGKVHFMDVLAGTCFGALPYERQDDGALAFTPWPLVNIPQPEFEGFLSRKLADSRNITLLRGVEAGALQQTADGVAVELNLAGSAEPLVMQAAYVVAADGANSSTRTQLDISMTGPEVLQHYMMIHFEADLQALTQAHPGLLYFCLSPEAGGVFIGYKRDSTWVFMQSFDPNTQPKEDFDAATCASLVQAAAGTTLPNLKIKNVSPWTMSAQVADQYRQGRVFLAGDAAHRFPPTGGLGLNTGIADAQNLAWKLAMVLQNKAGDELLNTYEVERRTIAQINCQQSLTNSAKIMHLFGAVYGPDPANLTAHYNQACANPEDPAIQAAVELQRPHFDSFNLQMGYQYNTPVDIESLNVSTYLPSFDVGHYLPLVELQDGVWLLGHLPVSEFSLLTGPDGAAWQDHGVAVFVEDTDFHPATTFHTRAALQTDGALLMRPDGHISARWDHLPTDPSAALKQALASALSATTTEN